MTAIVQETLNRELALRIGLAARALPDVSPRQLLDLLLEKLGDPLTPEKLTQITVSQLRTGLAGSAEGKADSEAAVNPYKTAVRMLWGEDHNSDLPQPQSYRDGDMPGSIRVAVASNHGEAADGHFGSCLRFLVYQVNQDDVRLIAVRSALETNDAEDRNLARAELIKDCQVLYMVSVGGPAAAKIIKAGIYPIKLNAEDAARAVLAKLQTVLSSSPPPWLAKIMGVAPEDRVRFLSEMDEPILPGNDG